MNFRALKGFWKSLGQKDTNNIDCDTSNCQQANSSHYHEQYHYYGHRPNLSFETKQAALDYINQIVAFVEQKSALYFSLLQNNDNHDDKQSQFNVTTLKNTQEVLSPLLHPLHSSGFSKESMFSFICEREEVITALDLCLYVIPDDEAETDNSVTETNCSSKLVSGIVVESFCENKEAGTKVDERRDVSLAADKSPICAGTAMPIRTLEQWRGLLRRIVRLLLEIDCFVCAGTAPRLRQSCLSLTPTNSLPISPGRTSRFGFFGNSPRCSTRNSLHSSGLVDFQQHPKFLKKGTMSTGPKTTGINCNDNKNSELRKAEQRVVLLKALVTWVILDNVLRHQAEFDSLFLTPSERLPLAKTKSTKYAISPAWDEIVEDLMKITGTTQQIVVEILISLWMLSDVNGQEFVQSVLQKPTHNLDNVMLIKKNSYINCEQCDAGSPSVDKASSCQNSSSLTPASAPERTGDDTCELDEFVENIENMYKQNIVLTWIAFLEQQSLFSFAKNAENNATVPMDLFHSHMMVTYALCSPYWNEEKQNRFFQSLQSVWDEWDEQSAVLENNEDFSPLVLPAFKLSSTTLEKPCSSNRYLLTKSSSSSSGDSSAASLNDQQKSFCMHQSAQEGRRSTSDKGSLSTSLISVYSFPQSGLMADLRCTEVNRMLFDEDVLSLMAIESWMTALHLRVEQCLLSGASSHIKEAGHWLSKERDIASAACFFLYNQWVLESFVKIKLAEGNYSEAFEAASVHLANINSRCLCEKYCDSCSINYSNSVLLLSHTQEMSNTDKLFLEQVQFVTQQLKEYDRIFAFFLSISGPHVVRHAIAKRSAYEAKLVCLREIWRAFYRINDAANATKYFEHYMEHIKYGCRLSKREFAYAALKERGKQLEDEKQYDSAVSVFKRAVEEAKKTMALLTVATTAEMTMVTTIGQDEFDNNYDASTQEFGQVMKERELELIRCEAESERNLAVAYVKQAQQELNIRKRRQQLNNAATSAYTALNILQRCVLKTTKPPPPTMLLLDVASSIVLAAKALLRLGQPKKAALLLEPLIEEKANSAFVRPPMWSNAPPPPDVAQSFTAADISECIETVRVKIAAYELHTLCLSKFDGERACREIVIAKDFLLRVKEWLTSFFFNNQAAVGDSNADNAGVFKEISLDKVNSLKSAAFNVLEKTNALLSALIITSGDSLALLGKWENALQEYSNALAMYIEDCHGSDKNNFGGMRTEKDKERLCNDKKIGESLVLAKLAEVYIALNKPKTAAHYYHQVLDYALEVGDALLEYNALIHLARLYTITRESEDVGEHWAKVSKLAKEYDDLVISCETTRNIVAAQRAKGMYTAVLNTAKELDELASAAEGVDAAADRWFALEALADAYLQLGQHKNCIETLDKLEKVQYKSGQWKNSLFKMRARALIGDGAVNEAIKVLLTWASEARQSGNLVEQGHANKGLAVAYAGAGQLFKARQYHENALYAFSEVSSIDRDSSKAVRESAQWLVCNFYLSNEKVLLYDDCNEKEECGLSDTNADTGGKTDHSFYYKVSSFSGDLSVLMQKEEILWQKNLESGASPRPASCSGSGGGGGGNIRPFRDEESEMFNLGDTFCHDKKTPENDMLAVSGTSVRSGAGNSDAPTAVLTSNSINNSGAKNNVISKSQSNPPAPTQTLANVTHCRRPAVMDGKPSVTSEQNTVSVSEVSQKKQYPLRGCAAKVQTFCFRRALETIERAAQSTLISPLILKQLIPRNPADVVDLAFLTYPQCTFVFYCLEFGAQYHVIVRPASGVFFYERSLHVYSLEEFHDKKHFEPSQSQESKPLMNGEPSQHLRNEASEKRTFVFASSLTSLTQKNRSSFAEVTSVARDQNSEWTEMNKALEHDLQSLYADLWNPVRELLRTAHSCSEGVDCLVLVVDPTLLHIPFPALQSSEVGSIPLGQEFTVVVTPTIVGFLQGAQRNDEPSLLDAPQFDRYVLLPEQTERTTLLSNPLSHVAPGNLPGSAVRTRSNSLSEEQHAASATVAVADTLWIPNTPHPWTRFAGCTRKEVISAFTSPTCRGLMLLCDPVGNLFRVADGMVRLKDMACGRPSLADSHDLVVVTCDRSVAPSADEPGVAARLCLDHGCRRVLRLDLPHGMSSISLDHMQLLELYVENLALTLKWRMRYPYALALRMTQKEALRRKFATFVWSSLTLVGAA